MRWATERLCCVRYVVRRAYSEARRPTRRPRDVLNPVWIRRQQSVQRHRLNRLRNTPIDVDGPLSSVSLASALKIRAVDVIKLLISLNACPSSATEPLPPDVLDVVAAEFGRIPVRGRVDRLDIAPRPPAPASDLRPRAPIVTLFGHVDHGKTSLLDAMRGSRIAATEAAGITQGLSAFSVPVAGMAGATLTVIDSPGHAIFGSMRQRGALCTDVAVLVVAADAGVQEQTVQSLRFIEAAGVPFVVAINKIDRAAARPDQVRRRLAAEHRIELAAFGGDVLDVEVSATEGTNLPDLLEAVWFTAAELELLAEQTGLPEAVVLDVRRTAAAANAVVAWSILMRGQLTRGGALIAGTGHGRVKHVFDYAGQAVDPAAIKPGEPFGVAGWETLPAPGDRLLGAESIKLAREVAILRQRRQETATGGPSVAAVDPGAPADAPSAPRLLVPIILRCHSAAAIEALREAIATFPAIEIQALVVRSDVGDITEQTVRDAAITTPAAAIFGVLVNVQSVVQKAAARAKVQLTACDTVFAAVAAVRAHLESFLEPGIRIQVLASAEVLTTFMIKMDDRRRHTVAGCRVTTGTIRRRDFQLVRDGAVAVEGCIQGLRIFKRDVKEVLVGAECGIYLGDDVDVHPGDVVQIVEKVPVPRRLEDQVVPKSRGVEEVQEDG